MRGNKVVLVVVLAVILTGGTVAALWSSSAAGPQSFGAPCANVTMIVVPGSNETAEGAGTGPVGMLAKVTEPIASKLSNRQLRVHYIGYPARLDAGYYSSKDKGYQATWSTLHRYGLDCVDTTFVLLGYSQGAHVVGDLTATIAAERAPVRPSRILGIFLLADPARDPAFTRLVGIDSGKGSGGAAGARSNFGELADRVYELCHPYDVVCDRGVGAGIDQISWGGVHTKYDSIFVPGTGVTYTDWMVGRINVLLGRVIPPSQPPVVAPPKPTQPPPTTRTTPPRQTPTTTKPEAGHGKGAD